MGACTLLALPACGEDDAQPGDAATSDQVGAAGTAGTGGSHSRPSDGEAGRAGEAGRGAGCDCGGDVNAAKVPLECACEAGLCTTFREDVAKYAEPQFGAPFYVLLGACSRGYRTLYYSEAGEQSLRRTYDARGYMVYQRFGGYDGFKVPDACGFSEPFAFGNQTIGEDPAVDCTECVLATDDPGAGGAGSDAPSPYPRDEPACTPSDRE